MKKLFLYLILLMIPSMGVAKLKDLKIVLDELDAVIGQKDQYMLQKEAELLVVKQQLAAEKGVRERYDLCDRLFQAYLHYQVDSALYYVERKEQLALQLGSPALQNEAVINRAEAVGIMGMFTWVHELLAEVRLDCLSLESKAYYYQVFRTYFEWQIEYLKNVRLKEHYIKKSRIYRDSILQAEVLDAHDRLLLEAGRLMDAGDFDQSLELLTRMGERQPTLRQQAHIYYSLATLYKHKGDMEKQIHYWALCAIADLKFATREYVALQELAYLLYQTGDLDRAYNYLNCSMDDAVACNARLRSLGISEFFPIIDKAYKEKEDATNRFWIYLMACFCVLTVFLFIGVFCLVRWNKNLSDMRNDLTRANLRLQSLNQELVETGKIKEVYIAHYLNRCVGYLDKLESYRRSLAKLAIASRIDDLFKAIKSEQFVRDERKNFYREFDESFLKLFPNFIQSFNALLQEEYAILPKYGELLTTELRIFALIRLGVTDSHSIAHFLGYSLATVYNYRSKMRNRAKGDKETFEQEVMNL